MKSLLKKPLSLILSLAMAVPTVSVAQGELSRCKPYGQETFFPCIAGRMVVRSDGELRALSQPSPQVQEVTRCVATDEQKDFPCQLAVGGFATTRAALREVRRRVDEERRIASHTDRTLSAKQVAAIIAGSPGIVPRLTPAPTAEVAPEPKPIPKPTPKPAEPEQAGMPKCGRTDQQRVFPCTLVVGGIAQDHRSLSDVRANVRTAQIQAQAAGRSLSASEITQIVAATPGIVTDGNTPEPQVATPTPQIATPTPQIAPFPQGNTSAAAGQGYAPAQVVTEAIAPGAVRSSDEEFDTAVSATGQDSGGRGLSKFEKTLLLGLGAVAVGSVLRNGDQIVSRSGDRLVVQNPQGDLRVLKDDDALIRQPGDQVQTQTFNDGSTRTIIRKTDGTQMVTIRGRDGTVLRRINVDAFGNQYELFDDTQAEQPVNVNTLPRVRSRPLLAGEQDEAGLRAALAAQQGLAYQQFSLRQVREIPQVRALAPELELDAVRFQTGSAAIRPEQARALARIGTTLSNLIAQDPTTVILVEGHTDAVGDASYNLALSDRRAETVALALTEYFRVPAGNLITQGYGEGALKIWTQDAEAANRRAVVRNITGLLR